MGGEVEAQRVTVMCRLKSRSTSVPGSVLWKSGRRRQTSSKPACGADAAFESVDEAVGVHGATLTGMGAKQVVLIVDVGAVLIGLSAATCPGDPDLRAHLLPPQACRAEFPRSGMLMLRHSCWPSDLVSMIFSIARRACIAPTSKRVVRGRGALRRQEGGPRNAASMAAATVPE